MLFASPLFLPFCQNALIALTAHKEVLSRSYIMLEDKEIAYTLSETATLSVEDQ